MGRGDVTTAALCKARAAESAYKLMFLLNKRYAPYYKWLRKGAAGLPRLSAVCAEVDRVMALPAQTAAWEGRTYDSSRVNLDDAAEAGFERIAAMFVRELTVQGLINGPDTRITFLE